MKYRVTCIALLMFSVLATFAMGRSGITDPKYEHHNGKTSVCYNHSESSSGCSSSSLNISKSKPASSKSSQKNQLTHWMTNSSKKRHNKSCRYFKNSKGRMCKPTEGIACKICGG